MMSLVQVHWNILKEEDRALKSIVDLSKITCKFVAQPYEVVQREIGNENVEKIYGLSDLKKLSEQYFSLKAYLGSTKEEIEQVNKYLTLYESKFKTTMGLSLYTLINNLSPQQKKIQIKKKFLQYEASIIQIDKILQNNTQKFICSRQISIIDVIFYFYVCNLVYFGKNQTNYPNVSRWFNRIYKIREIRIVTHQWFSMAKQIAPLLSLKKMAKAKL